ncbi:type I-E CRISPR-associated protein Cas5/CasD [Geobacter pickeringii]|uniref:type I-E CRISPR-associated protein Cas5/CasD n=1 Tax=Geobacter pickeringii TaxID=345632 RepID=UPI000A03B7B7|nr:type I-E CRISPR-associated protein Cas5/CasD [Geobacter pickeringii]
MSSDRSYLALRLEGPLQSWGFDSQYNRRNTGLMPTRSAVAGMCCAALGYSRGSTSEQEFLAAFGSVRMTAIAIPRNGMKRELPVRRLQDYHTVQNTRTAEGKIKDCHITHRQYLADATFGVLLEGEETLLKQVSDALENPVWGVWLGRKTCIPTAPVLAGLRHDRNEALSLLIGTRPLESFTRQEEADDFANGRDSLPDVPVSFASDRRLFSPRRIKTWQAGENA